MTAVKRGLPVPQYGPLDPTIMPPNLQMPNIVNIPERIQSVPDIDTRMKREIEESENDEGIYYIYITCQVMMTMNDSQMFKTLNLNVVIMIVTCFNSHLVSHCCIVHNCL